jgi:septum formation protein
VIVLASASPRRARLLGSLGVAFVVRPAEVSEEPLDGERGEDTAERLARLKAEAVAAVLPEPSPVVGADTLVLLDGEVLGKPASPARAREMLAQLSGRSHEVVTGLALVTQGRTYSSREVSRVRLAALGEEEIAWYVGTGEPLDKAGAYNIEGRGSLFIESVTGSPSNVAGLPVRALSGLFRRAGLRLFP